MPNSFEHLTDLTQALCAGICPLVPFPLTIRYVFKNSVSIQAGNTKLHLVVQHTDQQVLVMCGPGSVRLQLADPQLCAKVAEFIATSATDWNTTV